MQPLRNYVLFAALSFLTAWPASSNAQVPNVTVAVTGSGPSIDDARSDAIRQALQRTVEQLVVVDRAVRGNAVLRDRIISTMNGYIERFDQKRIARVPAGFAVTAEITVSASRIENFLGVNIGGGGHIDGGGLFAEQNRRRAQASAEALQAQARGEIFDRMFRGFPSEMLDVNIQKVELIESDTNRARIILRYSFKKLFIRSLIQTLKVLEEYECSPRRIGGATLEFSLEGILRRSQMGPACKDPSVAVGNQQPDYDTICVKHDSVVQCFKLSPGRYCASCLWAQIRGHGIFPSQHQELIIFGRFVDSVKQSAMRGNQCLMGQPRVPQGALQLSFGRLSGPRGEIKIIGLDLDDGIATWDIDTRGMDLARAKSLVALAAFMPSGGNPQHDLITSLVPTGFANDQNGCALLEEAVQRFTDVDSPPTSPSAAREPRRSHPVKRTRAPLAPVQTKTTAPTPPRDHASSGGIVVYEKDTDHPSGPVNIQSGRVVTVRVLAGTASVMLNDGRSQSIPANSQLTSRAIVLIEPQYPGFARFSVEYH